RPEKRPKELESRAGYFCADTFTPLTHNAYRVARTAVDCALTAADLLLQGERIAYALCRPPGHHAERAVFGGFCYFNNAAVAAHRLSAHGRVALLDIDYHHGNGSQDIFYRRSDVLVSSIHGHPNRSYPHFSGFADERGEGEGLGFNHNYPLKAGIDDAAYLDVLETALRTIRRFKPTWLVLSLGFDIMKGDPTGSFVISAKGMKRIAERIGHLGVPTLVVQEGGYSVLNLRQGAGAFFMGIAGTWY
ncbi:MAG: histone deacetylase family protein, partial [Rhodospirillales bacterium]